MSKKKDIEGKLTQEEAQELFNVIIDACDKLGWTVALCKRHSTGEVEGIVSGVESFVSYIMEESSPVEASSSSTTTATDEFEKDDNDTPPKGRTGNFH